MSYTIVAARFTLDTNVLVYAADRSSSLEKHRTALLLLEMAARVRNPLPLQAINEFCHATTKKRLLPDVSIGAISIAHMEAFEVVPSVQQDVLAALELHSSANFSYWDALLLVTSVRAECRYFFSEDMQDGFVLQGMRIINPFQRTHEQLALLLSS